MQLEAEKPPDSGRSPPPGGDLYPPSPEGAPPLAALTLAYRLQVVLVLVSLFIFLALYLALVASSGYLVWWLWSLHAPRGRGTVLYFGAIVGAVMLFLFLLKGLFKRHRMDLDAYVRISEKEEPDFFGFVRRLCAEAGSPFPRAIYLSHDVNAAVFYPRSIFSLFWPVRKNLLVGLGLVNLLNLSELKAVLAHEFGHFSQSSMKLGQYVYVANQVIADMIFGRDLWDTILEKWRRIDIRLSLPAWVLAAVVWTLRKLLGLLFRAINILNFSLSRQMELNADLHAVRLTGSDALIAGLWKTEHGNLAYQMALSGLGSMAEHGKYSDDVFFHQSECLGRLDGILAKAPEDRRDLAHLRKTYRYGKEIHFQEAGTGEREDSRWQTHPSSRDREINAKRIYLPHPPLERPAWTLFREEGSLRKKLSEKAYREMGIIFALGKRPMPAEEIQRLIAEEREEFEETDQHFGFYSDRPLDPGDIESQARELDAAAAQGALDAAALERGALAWTGEPLRTFMEEKRRLETETPSPKEAMRRLAEIRGSCAEADRAIFRHFYHLSGLPEKGSSEKRAEILKRYRFLLAIQGKIHALIAAENRISGVLQILQGGRKLTEAQVKDICSTFISARTAMSTAVSGCGEILLPRLSNLKENATVRSFVFPGDIIPPFRELDGEWIGKFLGQFQQVLGRLRKLHFKNLGHLLKLQEELDPRFAAKSPGGKSGAGG